MASLNKVILIGNVTGDPNVRYIDRGLAVADFSLATTEPAYTKADGTQVAERTEWHSIVLWRDLAEWAERYIKSGMQLYIEGRLATRHWEKNGVRYQKTDIVAENIQVLTRPAEKQPSTPTRPEDPYLQTNPKKGLDNPNQSPSK